MKTERTRLGGVEFIGLSAAGGLVISGVHTGIDVICSARDCAPADILIAFALTALPVIPITMLICSATAFVLRFFGDWRDRDTWVPVTTVATSILSLLSVVTILVWRDHIGMAVAFGLWIVPVAMLVCALTAKSEWILRPWRAVVGLLGITAAVILTTGSLTAGGMAHSASLLLLALLICAWAGSIPTGRFVWFKRLSTIYAVLVMLLFGGLYVANASSTFSRPTEPGFSPNTSPPNVVLIVLDTTRRDHLGVYGREPSLTPRLDRFAEEAVVYENAFAAAPWTIPSHASMFTGLFPVSHGCSNEEHLWLDDEFTTLAEMLKSTGYETLALNSNPYMNQCNLFQGFDHVAFLRGAFQRLTAHGISELLGFPERWVDKGGVQSIDALHARFAERRDPQHPFFVFLNLYETHQSYVPPCSERGRLSANVTGGLDAVLFGMNFNPLLHEIRGEVDAEARAIAERLYEAEVRYQDRRLGEWLDALGRYADLDDALIIVTADHGENLGEGGRWEHIHEINDALIHVPLIIRYPKSFARTGRVEGLCQLVDLVPSVFDIIEATCPVADLPGRALHPDRFQPYDAVKAAVAPYYLHFPLIRSTLGFKARIDRFNRHRRVYRDTSMKYVWSSDTHHELYDLTRDPLETENLIESQVDTARAMHEHLMTWLERQPRYVPPVNHEVTAHAEPVDADALRQLKSLGYIGG